MSYKTHARRTAPRGAAVAADATRGRVAAMPRYLARPAAVAAAPVAPRLALGPPGDTFEQEADRVAARALSGPQAGTPPDAGTPHARPAAAAASAMPATGRGDPLAAATREQMESRFGVSLGHVRVHQGAEASSLNAQLGSRAFTQGHAIWLGAGQSPSDDRLLAHELTHVVQQSGGASGGSVGPIQGRSGPAVIQRDLVSSFSLPLGGFEMGMRSVNGAANTPPTFSGLSGTIRFIPDLLAPNSNHISLVQIVRLTDAGGADVNPQSMPAEQAPRGGLGDPGVRTEDDATRGVQGGFFTDVLHKPLAAGAPAVTPGTPLSPDYPFRPAPGGGGAPPQTPGFKRSDDPADIRSSALFDSPGAVGPGANFDFTFETVARGQDTGVVYGAVHWGFNLRAGVVGGEFMTPAAAASATFDEALERHRDFYVHEPVTFYFAFDSDVLDAGQAARIDGFMAYLDRNPTVRLSLEGFADLVGGASAYNRALAQRRAAAVADELVARGVDPMRIDSPVVGHGASTAATTDAGTGDQGGNAAVGADQSREANRQMNRRVVLSFNESASTLP